jgi:hypothetical protein
MTDGRYGANTRTVFSAARARRACFGSFSQVIDFQYFPAVSIL